MELFDLAWFRVVRSFWRSSESCSATSHALMYSILFSTVLISTVGVYVWLRFIRAQPGVKVEAPLASVFVGKSGSDFSGGC